MGHTEACTRNLKLIIIYHSEDPDKDFKEFACQRHDPSIPARCDGEVLLAARCFPFLRPQRTRECVTSRHMQKRAPACEICACAISERHIGHTLDVQRGSIQHLMCILGEMLFLDTN